MVSSVVSNLVIIKISRCPSDGRPNALGAMQWRCGAAAAHVNEASVCCHQPPHRTGGTLLGYAHRHQSQKRHGSCLSHAGAVGAVVLAIPSCTATLACQRRLATSAAARRAPTAHCAAWTDGRTYGQTTSSDEEMQALLAALAQLTTLHQLASLVSARHAQFVDTPLCVWALLRAAQLRESMPDLDDAAGGAAAEARALAALEQAEQLLETLCDAAEAHVASLPLPSLSALTLALAQLDYYHEPLLHALVTAATALLSESSGPPLPAPAGLVGGGELPPHQGPPAPGLAHLPDELASGLLLSLGVGLSLSGHYDERLMSLLEAQARPLQAMGLPALVGEVGAVGCVLWAVGCGSSIA